MLNLTKIENTREERHFQEKYFSKTPSRRGLQKKFIVTLLERPPEKSCATSQFSREISCKIFSATKFQNHQAQLQSYKANLCNSKISRLKTEWSATHVTSHVPSWTPKTLPGGSFGWVFGFQLNCQCRQESDPRYAGVNITKKVARVTWESEKAV